MSESSSTIVGTAEAARLFGVRPSNFVRDWASRSDFPPPITRLATGRIWDRAELEKYRARATARRGTKRDALALSPALRASLPILKRRIVERFEPTRIIVFGSQARGEAQPDSDVDLLVVLPAISNRHRQTAAVLRTLRDLPIDADILLATEEEVAARGSIPGVPLNMALTEGRTIYVRSRSSTPG